MELKDMPALAGLNATQVQNFASAAEPVAIPAGKEICVQGQRGTQVYFLGRGKLRVSTRAAGGATQELAVLNTPCVVGEIELLADGAQAATVTAVEPCEGYTVDYRSLRARLADGDVASLRVVHNVSKQLAARLAAMDDKFLAILGGHTPHEKDLSALKQKLFGEWS